ncbi:MAG TPA: hypothetical protein VJB66_04215 [Candidatus Nanoarchaeia archaeon]|nr:hypothetical protein [Candidatus Nanoarchaeia archaeon]
MSWWNPVSWFSSSPRTMDYQDPKPTLRSFIRTINHSVAALETYAKQRNPNKSAVRAEFSAISAQLGYMLTTFNTLEGQTTIAAVKSPSKFAAGLIANIESSAFEKFGTIKDGIAALQTRLQGTLIPQIEGLIEKFQRNE